MASPVADFYTALSGASILGGRTLKFFGDILVAGDSLTDGGYPSAPYRWGLPLAGSPYRLIYNAGITNNTLDDLWARWTTDVLNKNPKIVMLRIGTNSITSDFAGFSTSYKRFTDSLQANGIFGILCAIPPRRGSGPNAMGCNAAISALAAASNGTLKFCDDGWVLATDAAYTINEAYYIDGIHMNTIGQYLMGVSMASIIKPMLIALDPRITSASDTYYITPSSNQWVKNPMMSGSGGGAYFATGTIPADWNVGCNGTATSAVCSVVAADAGDANQTPWLRLVPTIGGSADISVSTGLNHPAIAADMSVIKRLDMMMELRFNIDTTYLNKLTYNCSQAGVNVGQGESMGLGGNGVINKTALLRSSYARDQSGAAVVAYAANSISFGINISTSGAVAPGYIGYIDYRLGSVRGMPN